MKLIKSIKIKKSNTKLSRNENITILFFDAILLLSVFLPLVKVEDFVFGKGVIVYYISCFKFMKTGFMYVVPYIIPLIVFMITSLFIRRNRFVLLVNLISLIILSAFGISVLLFFFSYCSLYCIVYLATFIVIISIGFKKQSIRQSTN